MMVAPGCVAMAADVRRVDWFLETQLSRDGHEMWDPRDVATCEAQDGCLQQQWRLDSQGLQAAAPALVQLHQPRRRARPHLPGLSVSTAAAPQCSHVQEQHLPLPLLHEQQEQQWQQQPDQPQQQEQLTASVQQQQQRLEERQQQQPAGRLGAASAASSSTCADGGSCSRTSSFGAGSSSVAASSGSSSSSSSKRSRPSGSILAGLQSQPPQVPEGAAADLHRSSTVELPADGDQQQKQQQCALSTTGADADHADDVSAQKAAAQAQYAQEHGMQLPGGDTASAAPPAEWQLDSQMVQQEQARLQQHTVPDLFWCLLLCNLLCCLVVLAAKGSLGKLVAASHMSLPVLLLLSGLLGWLFAIWVKPMHFKHRAVEAQFAARTRSGQFVLDVWFCLAGCAGAFGLIRGGGGAFSMGTVPEYEQGTEGQGPTPPALVVPAAAVLQTVVPGVAMLVLLMAGVCMVLFAPSSYRRWREQLLFAGKLAIVSGLVVVQQGSPVLLSQHLQQQPQPQPQQPQMWLSLLGRAQLTQQAASFLLAVGAVQACLLLTLMVRVSAFIPMQLTHATALLVTVASSGSSGASLVLYAFQLLACGLWIPAYVLVQMEVSARRTFLLRCADLFADEGKGGKRGKAAVASC